MNDRSTDRFPTPLAKVLNFPGCGPFPELTFESFEVLILPSDRPAAAVALEVVADVLGEGWRIESDQGRFFEVAADHEFSPLEACEIVHSILDHPLVATARPIFIVDAEGSI